MKYSLLLISSFSLLILSCKKQDNSISEQKNILNDNAFIVDSTSILASTDNSFTLKKDTSIRQPKIGEIVLAAPSVNCQYGMLRKVLTINTSANSITYLTEQSNLNDAFKELHINTSYTDTFSSTQTFSRGGGAELTLDFKNNVSIGNGLKLNGILNFTYPKVEIKFEKENGSFSPKLISIKAELNSESQGIEFTNSNSTSFTVPEKIIKTFNNFPIIKVLIPIGAIPFPIWLKQKVDIACLPFEVNGKFKFTIMPNFSATLGCKYENGTWQNLSAYSIGANSPTNFTFADYQSNGSAITAQLTFLNPRYTITPMFLDNLSGTLEAPNKLTLEIKNTQPNYSLKYNLDVKGSIKYKFWLGSQGSFSISGNVIEKTLLEGNWNLFFGKWKCIKQIKYDGTETYYNNIYHEFKNDMSIYHSSDGINFSPYTPNATFTFLTGRAMQTSNSLWQTNPLFLLDSITETNMTLFYTAPVNPGTNNPVYNRLLYNRHL